jgi:hypothetical protein
MKKIACMLHQFLHTAKTAVTDINNFLKSNAEICMDLMMRLDFQAGTMNVAGPETAPEFNPAVALAETGWQEMDPRFFLEENY